MDKYIISIDDEFGDDLGINLISFVKNPAIQTKGLAFNKQEKGIKFSNDEVKMRIVAPAMIPMDIYRYDDEEDYEYEVRFTPEVIENIRGKFMENLKQDIFNLEHTEEHVPAYILETWIVGEDPKADKAFSVYGIEVPVGTMMVMSQITDRNYYDKLVEEEQFAYSIEGFFGLDELKLMINKKQETKMKKNVKAKFSTKKRFSAVKKFQDEAVEITDVTVVTDVVEVGSEVLIIDENLDIDESYNGELEVIVADDTVTVVIEEGTITEVLPTEDEIKAEEIVEEEVVLEDHIEEEIVEEEIVAEEIVEEEVKLEIDENELMTILQPKFEEIYKIIAELSAKIEEVPTDEVIEDTEVKMSVNERFSNVTNFLRKK